ncbi:uncharacterized protein LOC121641986 isoform X2 [Melanotaenia boesemani]|uniref:uncharacterized protein LOC121641986 isoform X2 n=1 Tax=Melanotaenia boesemani TaxID=1250792 RepID=UPI001C05E74E|nr:uncharacterized protein LOC121641986 isoform X2 [Melanotaenia boesemani]
MTSSAMTQKGFIFTFLLIFWNTYIFSGNDTHHLRFLLGCQAVIPCRRYSTLSDALIWFYKRNEHNQTIKIFFQNSNGVEHRAPNQPGVFIVRNHSLVIDNFTESYEGIYWCENCYKDNCRNEQLAVFRVKKEILNETQKTFNIAAGSSFTQACPGEFSHFKWTFEASKKITPRKILETVTVTTNKSFHITNVKITDSGKYTCWASNCGRSSHKLITINLCVIIEHSSEDALICNANLTLDGHTTVTSSYASLTTFNKTTGAFTQPAYHLPVVYGLSAGLACFISMAILGVCLKIKSQADQLEEESQVVYSSVVIRTPPRTRDIHPSHCVYSEIKI